MPECWSASEQEHVKPRLIVPVSFRSGSVERLGGALGDCSVRAERGSLAMAIPHIV
jgi:hypothetical protein